METLSCRDHRAELHSQRRQANDNGEKLEEFAVWTLTDVLLATGGKFVAGRAGTSFGAVSTDTRSIKKGDLFLALSGANFNGAEFAHEAYGKGAGCIIVDTPLEEELDIPVVLVKDSQRALGDLAAYRRSAMAALKVVGITGSSGKTTVKEMCGAIIAQEYNVLKTEGNFNNLIGMPLSLLPVTNEHDVAILEMGMNREGEIARMAEIADPDIACIVNIQSAHLAGLGSIEGVARAKAELFKGCKSWSVLCVNYDDKNVREITRKINQDTVPFGRHRDAYVRATHVKNNGEKGVTFTLHVGKERVRISLQVMGEHNVSNSLAAAAISHAAGLSIEQIGKGLEGFKPYDKRMQLESIGGMKIVNDCYNANPASMMAAFEAVQAMKGEHKTIAILGDMLELGESSKEAHRRLGEMVACKGFDYVLVFGEYAKIVAQGAMDGSMTLRQVHRVESKDLILQKLFECMEDKAFGRGDYFLVKGSRGMCMEKIVDGLRKELG